MVGILKALPGKIPGPLPVFVLQVTKSWVGPAMGTRLNFSGVYIRWNGMVEWNGGMEWWNGILEWNTGMEYWNGILEWNSYMRRTVFSCV